MIKTKYSIGDKVWLGRSSWSSQPVQCPDCLGKREWAVTTPAGETFYTNCRTCWRGYENSHGVVPYYTYLPKVEQLTIGVVQARQSEQGELYTYMCEETGVTSGSMYDEAELHPSEAAAWKAAEADAKRKRTHSDFCVVEDTKRQSQKDKLILEDCPSKVLRDEKGVVG